MEPSGLEPLTPACHANLQSSHARFATVFAISCRVARREHILTYLYTKIHGVFLCSFVQTNWYN